MRQTYLPQKLNVERYASVNSFSWQGNGNLRKRSTAMVAIRDTSNTVF